MTRPTGTRQSPIARIWGLLNQPPHSYRPATTIFLDLNVNRVADELQLATKGQESGSENRPTPDAQTLDDVEHQIVERIEAHKQDAHTLYLDHLHTYDERVTALSFEERFAVIQQAALEAVGDFRAEATMGRDELFALRRRLNESELERESFRARHRIERPARLSSPGKVILKIGVLAILFIIEVMINGSFLAKANVGGLLGGAAQAVTFAALNIIASFLWGLVLIRLINRRNYILKLVGLLSFLAYIAFAVALNLTLAHLREIPPMINVDVGQEVLRRLLAEPTKLTDINSWVFCSVGFIFSLIAMADGSMFFDPYIGYAGLERRWIEASNQFAKTRGDLIERLRDIREDATEAMNGAAHDLSVRRSEYDSLLQDATASPSASASTRTRSSRPAAPCSRSIAKPTGARAPRRRRAIFPGPTPWNASPTPAASLDTSAREHLRQMIAETQDLLKQQIAAIHQAFDSAVKTYREIDELLPEKTEKTTEKTRG